MNFCPFCANILLIEKGHSGDGNQLKCRTCVYFFPLTKPMVYTKKYEPKKPVEIQVGDVSLPTTEIECDKCHHGKARYRQIQDRSADEAMSIIYTCANCQYSWKQQG